MHLIFLLSLILFIYVIYFFHPSRLQLFTLPPFYYSPLQAALHHKYSTQHADVHLPLRNHSSPMQQSWKARMFAWILNVILSA